MADKTSLGLLGFLFAGVTVAVTIVGFIVVHDYVQDQLALDVAAPQLASIQPSINAH